MVPLGLPFYWQEVKTLVLKIKVDYVSKRVKGMDAMGRKFCGILSIFLFCLVVNPGLHNRMASIFVCVCVYPSSCQRDCFKLLILHAVLGQMLVK